MAERTVAAIATPNAAGGIGIVRISGGDALRVASSVFVPAKDGVSLLDAAGYTMHFGTVVETSNGAPSPVDQAVCLVFRAPASYTGEDAVSGIESGLTMDALSVCVDDAIAPLLELTGESVSDTIIEQVFATFCVGK